MAEHTFVNLKCSEQTRAAAKVAAALRGLTLFEYVDAIVLEASKADIKRVTGADADTFIQSSSSKKSKT